MHPKRCIRAGGDAHQQPPHLIGLRAHVTSVTVNCYGRVGGAGRGGRRGGLVWSDYRRLCAPAAARRARASIACATASGLEIIVRCLAPAMRVGAGAPIRVAVSVAEPPFVSSEPNTTDFGTG